MSGHSRFVEPETAICYRAYGRRFFTLKAALRWAAKQQIKQAFRATGDPLSEVSDVDYRNWVDHLAAKLKVADPRPFDMENPLDA